jgi:uncharacterized hydrophobic protein (TIGR00271 family)
MDMIHVRVVSPPVQTVQVIDRLSADAYVANLIVLRAAAHNPDGDLIECDVAAGAANTVLRDLRRLGLDRDGSVMVDPVDLALSRRAEEVSAAALGPMARAPIWLQVEARIRADATYVPSFYLFLIIAGVIGAVGLLTNSQILIVAAMIVGPEYGAITGVALGIDRGNRAAIVRGLRALTVGFTLAVLAAYAFTLITRALDLIPLAYDLGLRPVSHLIDTPDFYSVVVAVLAGIVGVVALTHARTGTLLGVFVSVTTIPAAADIGVALAVHSSDEAWGSLLQLLLNVVLLIVVGFITLRAQRAVWGRVNRRWSRRHPEAGLVMPSSVPPPSGSPRDG